MKKKNIEWLYSLARKKEGSCLSTEYFNSSKKYKWKCKNNHIWEAVASDINDGHWCPFCSKLDRKDIFYLHKLAKNNDGECLSENYVNIRTYYKWKCKNNHIWEATANNVQSGYWCKICSGFSKKDIDWLKSLVSIKNGKLLSNDYINIHTKYCFECSKGHIWSTTAHTIAKGNWCPFCKKSKSENVIENFLIKKNINYIREFKFKDCYHIKSLRFDFYLVDYNIIIEYDGEQHFKKTTGSWSSSFEETKIRDLIKDKYCEDNNIKLIRIPYTRFNQIEEILSIEHSNGFNRTLNYSKELRKENA